MIRLYILWVCSQFLHELGHCFLLRIGKVNLCKLVIGNFFFIKFSKIWVSPLVLTSYTEFEDETFSMKNKLFRVLVFLGGPIVNLLLFLSLPDTLFDFKMINLFMLIFSLLPLGSKSDGFLAVRELFKK